MSKMENVEEILPLSPVQAGMVFEIVRNSARTGTYVSVVCVKLAGDIDPDRLQAALGDEVQARDAFRAGFYREGVSQPLQVIRKTLTVPWQVLDWRDRPADRQDADMRDLVEAERLKGFDLRAAPLMRATLVRTADGMQTLVWTVHHLISDGWSTGVALTSILGRYNATGPVPAAAGASYRHLLAWQKQHDTTADKAFWSDYLAGLEEATSIPARPNGEAADDTPFPRVTRELPSGLAAGMRDAARQARVTPVSYMSAVWAMVLRRYAGRNDVVFGQTNAGRPAQIPGVEAAVGAFVNTLPVRIAIDAEMSVTAFLAAVEADARARRPHQYAALRDVQKWSPLGRHDTLLETLLVFEDAPEWSAGAGDALTIKDVTSVDASGFPLALLVTPKGDWTLDAIFDPARYPRALVGHILDDVLRLLAAFVAAGDASLGTVARSAWLDLPALAAPQTPDTVVADILAAAAAHPEAVALRDGDGTLSYGDLDRRSGALAADLVARGAGKGDVIPVALPRGCDFVVALLAVLRAGAAYTPLDLSYPAERLGAIVSACNARFVLGRTGTGAPFVPETAEMVDCVAADSTQAAPYIAIGRDDPAYVIFTSGSQGVPKGVPVSHGNLAYSTAMRAGAYPEPPRAFLLLSSFAFDSSVVGLYWTLTNGGALVISPPRLEQDPAALGGLLEDARVSHLLSLPGLYANLLDLVPASRLGSLTTVILAGEALPQAVQARHRVLMPSVRLYNEYGPTEATVWCAAGDVTDSTGRGPVPLGHPITGSHVVIADMDQTPLPAGVAGEITVTGPGVVAGYLDRDPVANAAFVRLPDQMFRTYRTGDQGCQETDGTLVYLGRADAQVKIRGHRVEIAEVETRLQHSSGAAECVVLVRQSSGGPELIGFLTGLPSGSRAADIRSAMALTVPAFMVPAAVHPVATLARLPNGKIDKTALLAEHEAAQTASAVTVDQGRMSFTETALRDVWASVLGRKDISRDDDFFDLGGDSLATMAVALKAEEAGIQLAPFEVFEYPRLSALADRIQTRARSLVQTPIDGTSALANPDGGKPQFMMIHGSLEMYSYLGHALGPDRPLQFLFSHFVGGALRSGDRIEYLAEDALRKLKERQPDGPYKIGGYSLGAIIALELAHRLRQNGDTVETLFLLDPSYAIRGPSDGSAERLRRLAERIGSWGLMQANALAARIGVKDKRAAQLTHVGLGYRKILTHYRPPVLSGRSVVMMTAESRDRIAEQGWMDTVLPDAERLDIGYAHLELQSDPDALMAWTSKLAVLLNDGETD